MLFSDATTWLTKVASFLFPESSSPVTTTPDAEHPFRVAIIGAGISGASAAYRLHELANSTIPLAITIYEESNNVGGRVKTIFPPESERTPLEAGAPHFYQDDWCLMQATGVVGLNVTQAYQDAAVWDGVRFRRDPVSHVQRPPYIEWTSAPPQMLKRLAWSFSQTRFTAAMVWKYGRFPWDFQSIVTDNLERWKSFGALGSFTDVMAEFEGVGLANATKRAGDEYLQKLGTANGFSEDFIEANSQALFGQGLAQSSGLAATMPPFLTSRKEVSAEGGNVQVIERLIKGSGADLHLDARVVRVTAGKQGQYRLRVSSTKTINQDFDFDVVILAAPVQEQEHICEGLDFNVPPPVPYDEAHVTHFSTYYPIPESISAHVTKLGDLSPSGNPGLQPRGYLSLTTATSQVRYTQGCGLDDECDQFEYVHRVLSRDRLEDDDILALVGADADSGLRRGDKMIDISWVDRQVWPRAFPRYSSRRTPGKVEIAEGLYYLGGVEDVLSTMEMGCRMGRNVGGLVAGKLDMPERRGFAGPKLDLDCKEEL